jgi:hypothetical protein
MLLKRCDPAREGLILSAEIITDERLQDLNIFSRIGHGADFTGGALRQSKKWAKSFFVRLSKPSDMLFITESAARRI